MRSVFFCGTFIWEVRRLSLVRNSMIVVSPFRPMSGLYLEITDHCTFLSTATSLGIILFSFISLLNDQQLMKRRKTTRTQIRMGHVIH